MRFYSSIASEATLAAGIDGAATSMQPAGATGYPSSTPFTVVIDPDEVNEEIVTVTGLGSSWTIVRGQDGTAALPHLAGAKVRHMATARDFREAQEHIDATTGVHGVTGNLVGTSGAQTLTNKTMSGTSNTFTNLPQSSVTGLPGVVSTVNSHVGSTAAHGATGAVVGTTNSQTLSNKTIHTSNNDLVVALNDIEDRFFLLMEGVATSIPGDDTVRFTWTTVANRGVWPSDGHSSRRRPPANGLYRITYVTGWQGTDLTGFEVQNKVYNAPADGTSLGTLIARNDKSRESGDFWNTVEAFDTFTTNRAIVLTVAHNATTWNLLGGLANTRVLIEYLGPV